MPAQSLQPLYDRAFRKPQRPKGRVAAVLDGTQRGLVARFGWRRPVPCLPPGINNAARRARAAIAKAASPKKWRRLIASFGSISEHM